MSERVRIRRRVEAEATLDNYFAATDDEEADELGLFAAKERLLAAMTAIREHALSRSESHPPHGEIT